MLKSLAGPPGEARLRRQRHIGAQRKARMHALHQMHVSGNCYKVRLAARQLGVKLVLKDYGLHDGATRKPEFLAKNPNGRVPLLELDDGRTLAESDAILWFLSEDTFLLPTDRWSRGHGLRHVDLVALWIKPPAALVVCALLRAPDTLTVGSPQSWRQGRRPGADAFTGTFHTEIWHLAEARCRSAGREIDEGPRRGMQSWRPALRAMPLQLGAAGALRLPLSRPLLPNDGQPE
jgi:glutathione S-transferase